MNFKTFFVGQVCDQNIDSEQQFTNLEKSIKYHFSGATAMECENANCETFIFSTRNKDYPKCQTCHAKICLRCHAKCDHCQVTTLG